MSKVEPKKTSETQRHRVRREERKRKSGFLASLGMTLGADVRGSVSELYRRECSD